MIFLGNGNGTFDVPIRISIGYFDLTMSLSVGDFNYDNLSDIVLPNKTDNTIRILLGNGNGKFEIGTIIYVDNCIWMMDISIADINHDNYSDIVVVCMYSFNIIDSIVSIFFGDINGIFSENSVLYTGQDSGPYSLAITDFNGDRLLDIAVVNSYDRNIGVFLGYGNGSFDTQKTSFTGGGVNPGYITIGDFNEDTMQDIAFAYQLTNANGVMFGHGNGTFSEKIRLILKTGISWFPVIVNDFNNDHHLDIAAATYVPSTINIYFGDGNGNFEMYSMFSTDLYSGIGRINTADFNGDGYQDIVAAFDFGIDIFLNTGRCNNTF